MTIPHTTFFWDSRPSTSLERSCPPAPHNEIPISIGRHLDDPCGSENSKGVLRRELASGTHSAENHWQSVTKAKDAWAMKVSPKKCAAS